MATEPNTLTLQQQIEDFQSKQHRPTPMKEVFAKGTQDLIESGIANQSVKQGDKAPDFALPNVNGETVQLPQLLAKGPVVLVFYRGGWCPYCNLALRSYQAILPEIQSAGATLVAVSPQTPDNSLSASEKMELSFPVLSDSSNKVAREYGLVFTVSSEVQAIQQGMGLDLSKVNGSDAWELPIPGSYVIARDGTIALAFIDPDYTHRLEPAAILTALDQLK
ncbi:MAG TPA: peroxiredoxin-like family protein [Ktedonobacteraceae bacterium]|nr:peroxiredoxin-like family protein [Ktedonobacteraceae bacterium]